MEPVFERGLAPNDLISGGFMLIGIALIGIVFWSEWLDRMSEVDR